MELRWAIGTGRHARLRKKFEKNRARAKVDRMGRTVKLYKKPSKHRSPPKRVVFSTARGTARKLAIRSLCERSAERSR